MRAIQSVAVLLALAAVAGAWVALGDDRRVEDRPTALLLQAKSGDVALRNSRDGEPLVTATGLSPGETVGGQLTLRNTGNEKLKLRLARRDLSDAPGSNGGVLSEVLQIQITETYRRSTVKRRRHVYQGDLAALSRLRLKALKPAAKRVYEFRVTMPDGGRPESATEGDNAYQGSMTSVDFVWLAAPVG